MGSRHKIAFRVLPLYNFTTLFVKYKSDKVFLHNPGLLKLLSDISCIQFLGMKELSRNNYC